MHDEKYHREDQENVDEKAGDVKYDERSNPDENAQQRKPEKNESHAGASASDATTQLRQSLRKA
jgi:hypothetical protein